METILSPATKEIVDAVGQISPKGQITPEAAAQLVSLAQRLEAGAAVYDYGLYALSLLALSYVLFACKLPRIAALLSLGAFICVGLIPYVQFTAVALAGFICSVILMLRKTPGLPA